MAITNILRDWASSVSMVRIMTTDSLTTVGTAGYIKSQQAVINQINNGPFAWVPSDFILVYSSNGGSSAWGLYTISSDFNSLSLFQDNISFPISIAKGGTGATTAAGARTNLGLGSIAVQSASAVAITGGSATLAVLVAPFGYLAVTGGIDLNPAASLSAFEFTINPGQTITDAVGLSHYTNGYTFSIANTTGGNCSLEPFGTEKINGVNAALTIPNQTGWLIQKNPDQWSIIASYGGSPELYTADTGTPFSIDAVTIYSNLAALNCGSSVWFDATSPNITLNVTDASGNTSIGLQAGNAIIGGNNSLFGYQCGKGLPLGAQFNTFFGKQIFFSTATGTVAQNVIIGDNGWAPSGAITAAQNTGVGSVTLGQLQGGSLNAALGYKSGFNWTGTESSNVAIASQGITGQNHAINIGTQGSGSGQQNVCLIAGIAGASVVAGSPTFGATVIDTSNGQLLSSTTGISSSGFVLTSNGTATAPTWKAVPSSATPWSDKSTSFNVTANNGYFCTAALTATLPTAPTIGSYVEIVNTGANALVIQAGTGDTIIIGLGSSTSGGTASIGTAGASIYLVYELSSNKWFSVGASQSTWTLA